MGSEMCIRDRQYIVRHGGTAGILTVGAGALYFDGGATTIKMLPGWELLTVYATTGKWAVVSAPGPQGTYYTQAVGTYTMDGSAKYVTHYYSGTVVLPPSLGQGHQYIVANSNGVGAISVQAPSGTNLNNSTSSISLSIGAAWIFTDLGGTIGYAGKSLI